MKISCLYTISITIFTHVPRLIMSCPATDCLCKVLLELYYFNGYESTQWRRLRSCLTVYEILTLYYIALHRNLIRT